MEQRDVVWQDGVMHVGCGDLLAGSCPVSFPCLFSVTQSRNGVCEEQAQNENINCLLVPPGQDQMIRRGQGEKLVGPQAGKWWVLSSQTGSCL